MLKTQDWNPSADSRQAFYFIIYDLAFKVCLSTLPHCHPQKFCDMGRINIRSSDVKQGRLKLGEVILKVPWLGSDGARSKVRCFLQDRWKGWRPHSGDLLQTFASSNNQGSEESLGINSEAN